jgi:hypothetical protein
MPCRRNVEECVCQQKLLPAAADGLAVIEQIMTAVADTTNAQGAGTRARHRHTRRRPGHASSTFIMRSRMRRDAVTPDGSQLAVMRREDRWIRRTAIGCVGMLAAIAGTVSYLHMHLLVQLHGQPGWVAALTPLSVDGMIVAASTTLLAESRSGGRGGTPP